MSKTEKEPDTYVLMNTGRTGAFIFKLGEVGIEAEPAGDRVTLRGLRLAVLCLNTGKSDEELYRAIEGLTP